MYRRSDSGDVKMHLTIVAVLIVVLTASGASSQIDCPEITEAELETVIKDGIPEHRDLGTPTVDVLDFHPVCLAYGPERDRYRYVSVVVEYTCTGNSEESNCPTGTAVEQFDSQCNGGKWSHSVQSNVDIARTVNPTANFSTTTREDCAFCFPPTLATSLSLITDPVTHCLGRYMNPFAEFCSIGLGDNLPQHVIHPAMMVS